MRRYSGLLAFSLCAQALLGSADMAFGAENELFSKVPIESVFSAPNTLDLSTTSSSSTDSKALGTTLAKNTLSSRLSDALHQKGFETKTINDRIVSTKAKTDSWTFPVIVTMSEDQKSLWLVLILNVVKDEKQIPHEKLLALLTANRQYAPAYFSYSAKQKRTELHRSLSSQGVTADLLKTEIDRLATIAKDSQELWNVHNLTPATEEKKPVLEEKTSIPEEKTTSTPPTKPETKSPPASIPETKVEPNVEAAPKAEAKPDPKPDTKVDSERGSDAKPEPKAEPKAEPKPEAKPELKTEPKPESTTNDEESKD